MEAIAEKYQDTDYRSALALRYSNYGVTLKSFGDADRLCQAVEYFQKSIALREELLAENNVSAENMWNLAQIYEELGNLMGYSFGMDESEKALVYLEKALEIKPENPTCFYNIYKCHIKNKDYNKAREALNGFVYFNEKEVDFSFPLDLLNVIKFLDEGFLIYLNNNSFVVPK